MGSIHRNKSQPDCFAIGPFVDTGSGPYDSAAEFYQQYPMALHKALAGEGQAIAGQERLLTQFSFLASSLGGEETNSQCGFGLANFDLSPNNTLVDREFNILAVIDWDSVVAVPNAGLYWLPHFMGIDVPPPGHLEPVSEVVAPERRRSEMKLCQCFVRKVDEVSRAAGQNLTPVFLSAKTASSRSRQSRFEHYTRSSISKSSLMTAGVMLFAGWRRMMRIK
jgi:hypothetical protein